MFASIRPGFGYLATNPAVSGSPLEKGLYTVGVSSRHVN
jgi:hypothetical protein